VATSRKHVPRKGSVAAADTLILFGRGPTTQVDAEEGKPVEASALGEQLKRVRAAADRAMKGRVSE
jgi:hypothetical protein